MSTQRSKPEPTQVHGTTIVPLPRVAIKFCVQCKWNLRAAYYAQELLSTFSLSLGEVALIPSTSGTFIVTLVLRQQPQQPVDTEERDLEKGAAAAAVQEHVLWDRKVDGGFPETKELKRRVRDLVEPGRGLGHVDRDYGGVGAEKSKEEESRKVGDGESGGKEEKDGERPGVGDEDENKLGIVVGNEEGDDGRNKRDDIVNDGDGKGDKCEDCI